MSDHSAKKLQRSQEALAMMFEANQEALVNRFDSMLKPLQFQVEELRVLMEAMSRQIDQIHIRQEAQERVNEQIVTNQEEKRIILHDINARLTEREQGSS